MPQALVPAPPASSPLHCSIPPGCRLHSRVSARLGPRCCGSKRLQGKGQAGRIELRQPGAWGKKPPAAKQPGSCSRERGKWSSGAPTGLGRCSLQATPRASLAACVAPARRQTGVGKAWVQLTSRCGCRVQCQHAEPLSPHRRCIRHTHRWCAVCPAWGPVGEGRHSPPGAWPLQVSAA